MFGASSELASVMEFGFMCPFNPYSSLMRNSYRSWNNDLPVT